MAQAIRDHGAFTLLVRDAASLAFAARHFDCRTKLCPDAALYLGCSARPWPPEADILALLRTDHEAVADEAGGVPSSTITVVQSVLIIVIAGAAWWTTTTAHSAQKVAA